jgi:hypothetical protein
MSSKLSRTRERTGRPAVSPVTGDVACKEKRPRPYPQSAITSDSCRTTTCAVRPGDDVDYPGADPLTLAAELCAAGLWERTDDGYRVLDAEAAQACVDRDRELREERAARQTRRSEPELPPEAIQQARAGATVVTRFGERTANGSAVSFSSVAGGEMAAVVKVARAGTIIDMGPPISSETYDHDGLVVDYFLGTAWHAANTEALVLRQRLDTVGARCPECLFFRRPTVPALHSR